MKAGAFDEALQTALRMKQAEVLAARSRFDGYSLWYQFSLRPDARVADCRVSGSTAERLSLANSLLSRAEARLARRRLREAQELLFNALALFSWLVNTSKEARQTLQDANLRHRTFAGESDKERADVSAFKARALATLSDCFLRAKNWRHALLAADECIQLEELYTKAHQVRFLAIINDPRTGVGDHEEALRVLRAAGKRNQDLRDFYSVQLRAVSAAIDREKKSYGAAFAARGARVVGSSSSGAGGSVRLSFGEALSRCRDLRRITNSLQSQGKIEKERELSERLESITASLEEHIRQVTNLGKRAGSEGSGRTVEEEAARTKRVLEALFRELDSEGTGDVPQSEEQLLRLAVDRVRYEEALEAAKKWVKHIKTPTMVSMLRSRSQWNRPRDAPLEEGAAAEDPLPRQSREELVMLLSESMARDIVEMIREDTAAGCDQDIDLFTRLMEKYDDDPDSSFDFDGKVYANEWVRFAVAFVVALYLVLMFYLSFAYPRESHLI